MKKIIHIIFSLALIVLITSGCEKKISTEDNSKITYYVTIELEGIDLVVDGSSVTLLELGTPWVDPGFTAMEGETDVTESVEIDGEVDHTTVGVYNLVYAAENVDGFAAGSARKVIVYDPASTVPDITGTYDGQRVGRGGGPVDLTYIAPGIFYCSDGFGGYYEVVAGYGLAYRARAYIELFADNTYISHDGNAPWGEILLLNGVYNPATETLNHQAFFPVFNFGFDVELVKQ